MRREIKIGLQNTMPTKWNTDYRIERRKYSSLKHFRLVLPPSVETAPLFADRFCRQAILYLSRNYPIKGGNRSRSARVPITRIDERQESKQPARAAA